MPKTKSEDKVQWVPKTILAGDLVSGNRIVTAVANGRVVKSKKVTAIDLCTSQWRTHIHVENMCYDTRMPITIAVPKEVTT